MPDQVPSGLPTTPTSFSLQKPESKPKFNRRSLIILVVVVLVLALIFVGVFLLLSKTPEKEGNTVTSSSTTTSTIEIPTFYNSLASSTSSATSTGKGKLIEYEITATNYAFSLTELRASPEDTIRLKFINNSEEFHDWKIDNIPGASVGMVEPGQTKTIEFLIPATATGNYTFYCPVSIHHSFGMEGTLIVQD